MYTNRRIYERIEKGRRVVQKHAESRPVQATGATEKRHGHERHVQETEHRLIDIRPTSIITRVCSLKLYVYLYLSYIYVYAISVADGKLLGFGINKR